MTYSLINNGDSGLDVRNTLNAVLTDINDGVIVKTNDLIIFGTFSIVDDSVELMLPTIDLSGYTAALIEGVALAQDITNDLAYGNQFYCVWKVSGGELTLVNTTDEYIKTDFTEVAIQFDTNGTNLDISMTGQLASNINGTCKVTITKI